MFGIRDEKRFFILVKLNIFFQYNRYLIKTFQKTRGCLYVYKLHLWLKIGYLDFEKFKKSRDTFVMNWWPSYIRINSSRFQYGVIVFYLSIYHDIYLLTRKLCRVWGPFVLLRRLSTKGAPLRVWKTSANRTRFK